MDALEAVGDPELRETLLWARGQAQPIAADDLADAHGIHRNVARARLERLTRAGLLRPSYRRRSGRSGPGAGRPAKLYSVTPGLEAIEFPDRRYDTLLGLLVSALPRTRRKERLRSIGVEFGLHLARTARLRPARSPETGFERMCTAVRGLGYQASVVEVRDDGAVIATPTCPLRPLVRAQPETVEIDRGMWAGLSAAALQGVGVTDVTCETQDCLDDHASCRVLIELRRRAEAHA